MSEKIYDIVPDATGWSCLINGVQSHSYPSWRLAMNGAMAFAQNEQRRGRSVLLRYQQLNGDMVMLRPEAEGIPAHPFGVEEEADQRDGDEPDDVRFTAETDNAATGRNPSRFDQ
jgi:hypothetical protein